MAHDTLHPPFTSYTNAHYLKAILTTAVHFNTPLPPLFQTYLSTDVKFSTQTKYSIIWTADTYQAAQKKFFLCISMYIVIIDYQQILSLQFWFILDIK